MQIGQVSFSSNSFVVCGTIVAGLEAGDVEAGAGGESECECARVCEKDAGEGERE